jgi:hypothetical protein
VKDYLEMTEVEVAQLVWIHSNKFTIPELFRKKFFPQMTYRNTCYLLNKYARPEKGFLHSEKPTQTSNTYYYLTAGAIRTLDAMDRLLVRSTKYPIKINPYEREHDMKVQEVRIAFEAKADLGGVFWVSDFEMRSGITPAVKARFQAGELDKGRWRSSWSEGRNKSRRTPDGYFEADVDGQRMAFAFEFENKPRSDGKIQDMVSYLNYSFPEATKMVVSAIEKNAIRMIRALQVKIKKSEQEKWFVSDFEKATTLPFKEIWYQLDHPLSESGGDGEAQGGG